MWSILQAIRRSWAQHFVAQFSGLVIMSLTYGAVIFIALSMVNIQNLFDSWGQISKVTVYLKDGEEKASIVELENHFKTNKLVHSYQLVTSEQAAQKFNKTFSKVSSETLNTKKLQSFFPQYFELTLNETLAYKSGGSILEALTSQLIEQFSQIQNISYGKSWLERYSKFLSVVQAVAWFLIGLFLVASVVVSSNVIKSILFAKKEEIEILEFIGADDVTIFLPQICNILSLSLAAFVTASLFNAAIYSSLVGKLSNQISADLISQMTFVPAVLLLSLMLVSLLSVFFYSVFSIHQLMPRKHNLPSSQGKIN